MRKAILIIVGIMVLAAGTTFFFTSRSPTNKTKTSSNAPSIPRKETVSASAFNKTLYSLDDPVSLWIIVNKTRPTSPVSYIPSDLTLPNVAQRLPGEDAMKMRQPAAEALEKMFTSAKQAGIELEITTAYRGYSFQKSLYDSYVVKDGQQAADTYSARPGYSEHQTGLAVDIRTTGSNECYLEECFGETASGKWLQAHSQEYGFILRYPKDQNAVTGYQYEPWHFRYVGNELASELKKQNNPTLEKFFGLPAAPDYL